MRSLDIGRRIQLFPLYIFKPSITRETTGVTISMNGSLCRQLAVGYFGVSASVSAASGLRLWSPLALPCVRPPAAALSLYGLSSSPMSASAFSTTITPTPKPKPVGRTTGYSLWMKEAWVEMKAKGGVSLPLSHLPPCR